MGSKKLLPCLWLCFISLGLNAQSIQDLKIKGSYTDKPLSLVFLDLEINYRLKFEFEEEEIKDIYITQTFSKTKIESAFRLLLSGTGLGFELRDPRTVLIFEERVKPQEVSSGQAEPSRSDFTITGVVKDQTSGETLPFASVILEGTTVGTSTNVDGYFSLFNVPSDTALLSVQYLGYQTKYFRLNPELDIEKLEIVLEPIGTRLDEILVLAQKEEQMMKASTGISKIGISPAQISSLPSFGEKDIFRSLQLLPGISGTNESSSGLYVRGGTPDQNLILFDGFTVYHVDHLFGFFSAFNSNAIKDVQLHKGGFEAKYGGRLSSVVELTGKNGNTEQFNMGLGLSLLSYNGYVEAPFADGKGSFLVAGRRSFQSNFYTNLFDAFTEDNAGPGRDVPQGGPRGFGQEEAQPNSYFYDLNAKVTYRPSKKDVFALSFYNGEDNLDNSRYTDNNSFGGGPFGGGNSDFSFTRDLIDLSNWGNWGASAKWSRRWSDKFYTNANLSYSNYFSERNRSNETTVTREDTTTTRSDGTFEYNDLKDFTMKLDNELKLSPRNELSFGLQTTYNDIQYTYTQNDTIALLNRQNQGLTAAAYVQDQHTLFEKLILKGGLRASYYDITSRNYFEPRASLTYLLNNKIKLKGAWGIYHQFATRVVREDIQQGSRDFWLLADDERLPIGYAEHYIAGLSYETNSFLFDIEGYYKNLDGLSEYTTRFAGAGFGPNRTLNYEELFYTGTGVAKGVEFLIQKKDRAIHRVGRLYPGRG